MQSVALFLCLVLALVPRDLSAQVRTWTAVVDTVGSAPRITSPGYTAWRDTTTGWVMRHERTFPVRAHDPALPMSRRQLLLLSDNRTVVASAMPAAVEMYDSTGAYSHQIGMAGNGPGEYLMPTGLAMLYDTLLVLDSRQMRILFYTLDGRYLRTFFTGVGGGMSGIAVDRDELIRLEQNLGMPGGPQQVRWTYFMPDGKLFDSTEALSRPPQRSWTFHQPGRSTVLAAPFQASLQYAFLPNGHLVHGVTDRFELIESRSGSDTVRIMARSGVNADSIRPGYIDTTVVSMVRGRPELEGIVTADSLPRTFPLWNELAVDGRGFLWVSVGKWSHRTHYFAIFGPDGRYLGPVLSRFEDMFGSSWNGDHVAVTSYDRERKPIVRVYRIDRQAAR